MYNEENFTPVTTPDTPCTLKINEPPTSSKGLFTMAMDTYGCLSEIAAMLDRFANEIKIRPEGCASKRCNPECFTDNLVMNNDLAHAIMGDLRRLMEDFER